MIRDLPLRGGSASVRGMPGLRPPARRSRCVERHQRVDQAMHAREGGDGAVDDTLLLRAGELRRIERSRERAP